MLSRKYLRCKLFYPSLWGNIVSQEYALQSISNPAARAIISKSVDFLEKCHYGQVGGNPGELELVGGLQALFGLSPSTRQLIDARGACDSRFYRTGDCTCTHVQDCLVQFMRADGLPLPQDIPCPDDTVNPGSVTLHEYWTSVPIRNVARTTNQTS